MKTVKFKTNINCSACVKSVSPFLNELDNINTWKVDTDNPDKILEVELDDDNQASVIEAVNQAAYTIEQI
ncbi:copper chaperone [Ancylomarina salipaludis]|uniref:Copper chaperone n=1 Tax=Ancylomarina salipaludis TaxID=2501299 RepID=A0A4Q1JK02_9BACT|nr:heavy-metal-associated domain-containing protein [Ancylomarina salipaludis]RXQ91505.1 copper chaperone [Ancylomarina salipaludis]